MAIPVKAWAGIAALTLVLAAAFLIVRTGGHESAGSTRDPAITGAGPAPVGGSPTSSKRTAAPDAASDAVGEAAGAGPGGTLSPLGRIDYGNMDERPWVYRSEAERQAAMRAAREQVLRARTGQPVGATTPGIEPDTSAPLVTGDGPLGPASVPAKSGLPGPGERVVGGVRTEPGPSASAATSPAPEHGRLRPNTTGPARPGTGGAVATDLLPVPTNPASGQPVP